MYLAIDSLVYLAIFICSTLSVFKAIGYSFTYLSSAINEHAAKKIKATLCKKAVCLFRRMDGENLWMGHGPFYYKDTAGRMIFGFYSESISDSHHGVQVHFTIYMLATPSAISALQNPGSDIDADQVKDKQTYKVYSFDSSQPWNTGIILLPDENQIFLESKSQQRIASMIAQDAHLGVCALLYGPPGTGKSNVSRLIAEQLGKQGKKPAIVIGFDPTKKGNSLEQLLSKVPIESDKPVIVCLEEFDRLIKRVHEEKVERSEHFNIVVTDKASLANFLDRVAKIRNLIVIATTNMPIEWFDTEENAYITRSGRFAYRATLENLSAEEALNVIKDGCKKYGINAPEVINVKGAHLTMAKISDAFYRCRDYDSLIARLA